MSSIQDCTSTNLTKAFEKEDMAYIWVAWFSLQGMEGEGL